MTQQKETFTEPAEIISCTEGEGGQQWEINVKWQNAVLNPNGGAENTYMKKSIEDRKPYEPGVYVLTVSKGNVKYDKKNNKPFDGTKEWMYYYTTHEVRTYAEQDALPGPDKQETEDLFSEDKPVAKTYEQIQVSQNDSITNQVILKEIGLTQRTMIEKDQIKYTTLSEAREDLIKESKLAQLQYRDSE